MNHQIRVKNQGLFAIRGVQLPGPIFTHPPFRFAPMPFGIETEYLKTTKNIDAIFQQRAFDAFLEEPTDACTYAVASEPDADHARYLAAFMLQHYLSHTKNTRARWYGLHEREDILKNRPQLSFLVIQGCNPKMTAYRMEKVRDLIEHYHSIPKIVVIGGADPITFFSQHLHLKPDRIFYHGAQIVRRKVEVI